MVPAWFSGIRLIPSVRIAIIVKLFIIKLGHWVEIRELKKMKGFRKVLILTRTRPNTPVTLILKNLYKPGRKPSQGPDKLTSVGLKPPR